MSRANLELVQELYDAFKRGDIATIVAALTPDVHWQVHGRAGDFPTIGQWSGPHGAQEFFRRVDETLEVAEFTPHQLHASGDKVFVMGHYRWKVRRSGKPAAAEWCHAFTIRGGKVAVFREFTDTAAFADAYRG